MANVMFYSYIEVPDEEVDAFIEDYTDESLDPFNPHEEALLERIFQGMDDASEEFTEVEIYSIEKQQ